MTQPKFAPVTEEAEVRPAYRLAPAAEWYSHRPADYRPRPREQHRPNMGIPGSDQGYALLLAERFAGRLQLTDVEHVEDVLAGCVAIALRRASMYRRSPVIGDVELPLRLFGFLGGAPEELVEARERLFAGISHDYWQQRDLADLVPESTLRLTPAEVGAAIEADHNSWMVLTGLPG